MTLFITERDVEEMLSIRAAIPVMEEVFRMAGEGTAENPIDERLIERAKLVVVDEKEHSKVESGDLLWAIAHGLLRWDKVWNLGDVIVGRAPVPDFKAGAILFESHGLAIEDVAIAAKAYELARAQGLGTDMSL